MAPWLAIPMGQPHWQIATFVNKLDVFPSPGPLRRPPSRRRGHGGLHAQEQLLVDDGRIVTDLDLARRHALAGDDLLEAGLAQDGPVVQDFST